MKSLSTLLVALLLFSTAQADQWASYNYLGFCTGEETPEGKGVMKFYSEEFQGLTSRGFASLSIGSVDTGAFAAIYTLTSDHSAVQINIDDSIAEIPFGVDQVFIDDEGYKMTCTLTL